MLKKRGWGIIVAATGVVVVVLMSVMGWVVLPDVIDGKIKQETQLTNQETRERWENISSIIQLRFHIYNITNSEGIAKGEKLKFVDRGPYVYNEVRIKNATFSEDGTNVTYRQTIHYHFDREASVGPETETFNVPNIPIIAVAHVAHGTLPQDILSLAQWLIALAATESEGLIKHDVTVSELLFEGWNLHPLFSFIPVEMAPPELTGGKFGIFKNRNGSDDGEYVVATGNDDPAKFGKILTWNGMEELPWWNSTARPLDTEPIENYCNKINGTDATIYPPFITKDTVLRAFNTEISRSLYMKFHSEVKFKGIPGYRFVVPPEANSHPVCNKDNRCFCQKQSSKLAHQCVQSLVRMFPVKGGAPVATTNARFLDGGEELFEGIDVPAPIREFHESYVDVEPRSGMVLRGSYKIQANVELQQLPGFTTFESLDFSNFTDSPSIFLPVFWAEEGGTLSDEDASDLESRLIKPVKYVGIATWVIIAVGAMITAVGMFLVFV